jgi:GNAT superfamily N-acetyltransferase
MCVLDFFVHQKEQRKGYGKAIYEAMLKYEKVFLIKIVNIIRKTLMISQLTDLQLNF